MKKWTAQIVQSSKDGDRLRDTGTHTLSSTAGDSEVILRPDPAGSLQEILGFGGAFTEAAGHTLARMSPEKRQEVIDAYFHPVKGIGYSFCRTHINSCDFSTKNWACDETPGDVELKDFTLAHDRQWLIPLIRDAFHTSARPIRLFASPWSPPAWMKTTGRMNDGGALKPEYREVWARYFARWIKEYEAEGIPIWGVSIQNEPEAKTAWDNCLYTHEEERDFLKILGPTLEQEGLGRIKIIVWDHNKDHMIERADTILSDPEAARWAWGVGFHWYSDSDLNSCDNNEPLRYIHEKYGLPLVFTEGCNPYPDNPKGVKSLVGQWWTGEKYAHHIISDLNSWTAAWTDWNIVLDECGGPNHVFNHCDAPVICDTARDTIHYNSPYYTIAHFSKFIPPGSVRIPLKNSDNTKVEATAARTTDGQIIIVALNPADVPVGYRLEIDGVCVDLTLPAHAIQSVILKEG